MKRIARLASLGLLLCAAACSDRDEAAEAGSDAPDVPDLGEIMTATQIRHGKLFFAGESENWDLAAYELKELGEGFEAAARFHPEHEGRPVAELLPVYMTPPLESLGAAIEARDRNAFRAGYDRLTASCNACHEAAQVGFNRIARPTSPPFTNQDFAPSKKP